MRDIRATLRQRPSRHAPKIHCICAIVSIILAPKKARARRYPLSKVLVPNNKSGLSEDKVTICTRVALPYKDILLGVTL